MRLYRLLLAVLILLVGANTAAWAVGVQDAVAPDPDDKPIAIRIWYPTAPNSDAVAGTALPLVVISHGTGGDLMGHTDTAIALAEAGFVAVALRHTGDNYKDQSYVAHGGHLIGRPRHVSRVIDYMLTGWAEHGRIDPARIGLFGHSAGGFTALVVAGGVPDIKRGGVHCREHPDAWDCRYIGKYSSGAGERPAPPPSAWVHDPRVKAAVVAAPCCGYMFQPDGLAAVHIPLQLWDAEKDTIVDDSPAIVRSLLPPSTDVHRVDNAGHFSFLTPCNWKMRVVVHVLEWTGGEHVCTDPDGFDRAAFHRTFDTAVVAFFKTSLAPP